MVWTYAEEGEQIYWQQDAQNGATSKKAKKETCKKIDGSGLTGHADGVRERGEFAVVTPG